MQVWSLLFSHYFEVSIMCFCRRRIYIIVPLVVVTFMHYKQSMDDSLPLAVESFSTSWLSNAENSYDVTSKLMDCKNVKPSRFLDETHSFKFNIPIPSSVFIAHADELFFDGSIKPDYIGHTILGACNTADFIPDKHTSSLASLTCNPAVRSRSRHRGRWRRSLVCILHKCLECFSPICHKLDPGEGDIKQEPCEVKSQLHSPRVSPQRNSGSSTGDWCHVESSIYEAILHCKKSIGT